MDSWFPKVVPVFNQTQEHPNGQFYEAIIQNTLKKILKENFEIEGNDQINPLQLKEKFFATLPLIKRDGNEQFLCGNSPSFYLLADHRSNLFKFFFEMISNWLIPGKRLNILLFNAIDFYIPAFGEDRIYALCEIILQVDSLSEQKEIFRMFPNLAKEIHLGVSSAYFARRILEIKGLTMDEKMAMIQENITFVIKKNPNFFNYNIFVDMQHLLSTCSEEFKNLRGCRHLARMICIHYYFRKTLVEKVQLASSKRYVKLKIFRSKIPSQIIDEKKNILGIIVAVNFFDEKEIFDGRHLLKAIEDYLPGVALIEGSLIVNRWDKERICLLYIEIEKIDGTKFRGEELLQLRRDLGEDLKDRIEHLMHPVFMPRNEEEIMRNILSLSNQIKYLRDIPQLFVSFDEQTQTNLFFTIIIVRVLINGSLSIKEMFNNADTFLQYIHDSQRIIGCIRKKYSKEATVFRVRLLKNPFLREDHSIDLYKARSVVVSELVRIIGKIRDFNGGLISKQNDALNQLRRRLADIGTYNDFLLENFFYSLHPAIMRTLISPDALKILFLMMIEGLDKNEMGLSLHRDLNAIYVMILSRDSSIDKALSKHFSNENILSVELATTYVNYYGSLCLGYIYTCDDPYKQDYFCQAIEVALLNMNLE